ncbi:hypothetical protein [Natronolimnohabitans innermongolicus]|uniref:Uncharacterized protein n=1 Tax=Natronolimnohabitans innermongolicus JCM 12255 TaxID=1227499 RepID=L9XNG2_9EURY|nr:hypothetical protein [Natronolimnohabitans innermongolicus]ELY62183.1 hypothetical protein C493_00100 [Natronolimnohabitans innermongolicus JCM 12255]
MDSRLIITAPFVAYLAILGLFAIAQSAAGATFSDGQPVFLLVVGVLCPLFAFGLIWMRNYRYGPPLLIATLLPNGWFVSYFFFVHDNSANVFAVSGDGALAYTTATAGIVLMSLIVIVVAGWLWYHESSRFRTAVDGFIRPDAVDQ